MSIRYRFKLLVMVSTFLATPAGVVASDHTAALSVRAERELTDQEVRELAPALCTHLKGLLPRSFSDSRPCFSSARLMRVDGDTAYGSYIYGTFQFGGARQLNCAFPIEAGTPVGADCGDE
jgi:hypothetical protein